MDQALLLKLWQESWDQNTWVASWSKAVTSLTAAQACWRPAPLRHCIWQIVNHVCIWRELTLSKIDGRKGPSTEELSRDNFAMPPAADAAGWKRSLDRLRITHEELRKAIATPGVSMERLPYHLTHDAYHLGQIMYLRALQDLPPIE